VYNTISRKLEVFEPLKDKEVRMYNCGPTVYDYPHIGNYRSFCFADLLKRYLLWKGYKVIQVMNITDVDDKLIKKVNESKKSLKEITSFYEKEFLKGLEQLNCIKADYYPRATEHIKDMQEIIQKLLDKGYAYLTDDGIYYSISKFKDYGKLSGIKKEELKAGARVAVQEYSKEQASDFALWKKYVEEDGDIFWEPEFVVNGKRIKIKGRPGWHIECSAMSRKYLGESFDIHTGAVDLIFPHHENEIAQSEAASERQFVKYWMHNAFLIVEGKKMSKSLGNFYTLRDILDRGYKGYEIRYVLLNCHYREQLNFTFKELEAARETIKRIIENIDRINSIKNIKEKNSKIEKEEFIKSYKDRFEKEMDNDLNLPGALSVFFGFLNEINKKIDLKEIDKKDAKRLIETIYDFDAVLGLGLKNIYNKIKKIKIPSEIKKLLNEREKARKEKNFKLADEIREKIKAKGWTIEDSLEGPKIKKIIEEL